MPLTSEVQLLVKNLENYNAKSPLCKMLPKTRPFQWVTNTIKSLLIYTKIGKKKIMDGSLVPRPHPAFRRLQSFFVRTWGEPGNEAGMSPWVTCSCSVPKVIDWKEGPLDIRNIC